MTAAAIKKRAAELRADAASIRDDWLKTLIGTEMQVLAEADGTGHAPNFARVALPAGTLRGAIVAATPRALEQGLLR